MPRCLETALHKGNRQKRITWEINKHTYNHRNFNRTQTNFFLSISCYANDPLHSHHWSRRLGRFRSELSELSSWDISQLTQNLILTYSLTSGGTACEISSSLPRRSVPSVLHAGDSRHQRRVKTVHLSKKIADCEIKLGKIQPTDVKTGLFAGEDVINKFWHLSFWLIIELLSFKGSKDSKIQIVSCSGLKRTQIRQTKFSKETWKLLKKTIKILFKT